MSVYPGFEADQDQEEEEEEEHEQEEVFAVNPKYYDLAKLRKEVRLWSAAEKKHPWYDPPAKVKVKTEKGVCHLKINFTLGLPPEGVYEMLTNPNNLPFFREDKNGHQRLENISTKVLKKDGPRQITKVEKALTWNFLWLSGAIPIHLTIDENHKNLSATYTTKKMALMKVFKGSWKVEPLFVDQERLCKKKLPESRKEYKRCSRGKGKVGSKVTMEQVFQPSWPFSMLPFSWFIRGITIKTTKTLLEDLRKTSIQHRRAF
ncbi:hypothetical protein AALP_AA1G257000 [Arabis alpina]|uniref:DUF220 domain-containing protein n=1 Tax=Arabis alpina TaxID=50452 RepID=A0A087HQP0_ARAAL|nr:hypothetical protein AALP_AA1G257000 [Arabis alpina]